MRCGSWLQGGPILKRICFPGTRGLGLICEKTIRKELVKKLAVNSVTRMRFKLERWHLSGLPGLTATRFLRALGDIKNKLPPKVGAAVLRASWNGWCTSRRFQKHGQCMFGCNSFIQEDSLEHYSGCSVCLRFLRDKLHYKEDVNRGHLITLGANSGQQRDEDYCRLALWSFVLYKSFNKLRTRTGNRLNVDEVQGLMNVYLQDGVSGHREACRFLDNCWDQKFRFRTGDEDEDEINLDGDWLQELELGPHA